MPKIILKYSTYLMLKLLTPAQVVPEELVIE
jgi:hypothetical protein